MIKHAWSLLCSKSIIDKDTNNLTITNTLERIVVDIRKDKDGSYPKNVNIPMRYEVVSLWHRSKIGKQEEFNIKYKLLNAENRQLWVIDNKAHFKPENRRLRTRNQIQGFPISESGIYKIFVEFRPTEKDNFIPVAELPIEIVINGE